MAFHCTNGCGNMPGSPDNGKCTHCDKSLMTEIDEIQELQVLLITIYNHGETFAIRDKIKEYFISKNMGDIFEV